MKRKLIIFVVFFVSISILSLIIVLKVRDIDKKNERLTNQLSQTKTDVEDLRNIIMDKDSQIGALEEKLAASSRIQDNIQDKDLTNRLENQDIFGYQLIGLSSLWKDSVPVYGDYYLAFLNKLLYSRDYYWIEEVEFEEEEIEIIESTVDSSNFYIKFILDNSINTLLTIMPADIDELIFIPKENDSQMYVKSGDIWHSYIVKGSDLSFDMQILSTIIRIDYEFDVYAHRD